MIIYFFLISLNLLLNPDNKTGYGEVAVRTDTVWRFEKYSLDDDIIFGIWPNNARISDSSEISRLKDVYGFSHIFFHFDFDTSMFNLFLRSGFSRDRIMVHITPENYRRRIRECGTVYAYYVDEPNERGKSTEGMREYIDRYAAGSLFIISGYRRTSGLRNLASPADGVMFSSYKHWWQCFPGVWCAWPEDPDQRADWTDMRERFGEKSFMNWIGAHRDTLEYDDLLTHTRVLKLKGVWIYQYQDVPHSLDNLSGYCSSAWSAGYLKKYERRYILKYRQDEFDPSGRTWRLSETIPTGELREIYPSDAGR